MLDAGSTDVSLADHALAAGRSPLAAGLYWMLATRRRKSSVQYASLETVGGSARRSSRLRRTMPLLLWTLGLTALILAIARPQAALTLPARLDAIVLALDMSNSMRATDVKPNRLSAARDAAKTFIEAQPRNVRIGVVAVAASAAVVQSPTNNREDLTAAIDRLETQRGTALGSGLIIALDAALPAARINVEEFINPRPARRRSGAPTSCRRASRRVTTSRSRSCCCRMGRATSVQTR